jgi:hypothetical protein
MRVQLDEHLDIERIEFVGRFSVRVAQPPLSVRTTVSVIQASIRLMVSLRLQ